MYGGIEDIVTVPEDCGSRYDGIRAEFAVGLNGDRVAANTAVGWLADCEIDQVSDGTMSYHTGYDGLIWDQDSTEYDLSAHVAALEPDGLIYVQSTKYPAVHEDIQDAGLYPVREYVPHDSEAQAVVIATAENSSYLDRFMSQD